MLTFITANILQLSVTNKHISYNAYLQPYTFYNHIWQINTQKINCLKTLKRLHFVQKKLWSFLVPSKEIHVHAPELHVLISDQRYIYYTNYCLKKWKEWANYRNATCNFMVHNCSQLVPIEPELAEVDNLIYLLAQTICSRDQD